MPNPDETFFLGSGYWARDTDTHRSRIIELSETEKDPKIGTSGVSTTGLY